MLSQICMHFCLCHVKTSCLSGRETILMGLHASGHLFKGRGFRKRHTSFVLTQFIARKNWSQQLRSSHPHLPWGEEYLLPMHAGREGRFASQSLRLEMQRIESGMWFYHAWMAHPSTVMEVVTPAQTHSLASEGSYQLRTKRPGRTSWFHRLDPAPSSRTQHPAQLQLTPRLPPPPQVTSVVPSRKGRTDISY